MPDFPAPYELRNLRQTPADNLGGIEAVLWYTRAADVLRFPAEGELVIRQSLALREGACWYQVVSTRGTVRYKQTPKAAGRHDDLYQQRLQGTLARHSAGLAQGLEALSGQQLLALYRDYNGQVQLLGTPEQPLSWLDSFDSAADPASRNNYDWTLQADTPRRARPYLGSWLVSGVGLEEPGQLQGGAGGSVELRTASGRLLEVVPAGRSIILTSGFKLGYQIQ